MLNSVSEDLRTALVCETFGDLTTQDKARVLFTTGDDVRIGYLSQHLSITLFHISGHGSVFNYH